MTTKDYLNEFIIKINNTFNIITHKYNIISTKIPNLWRNDIIPYEQLIDLDISMNDLLINVQSLLLLVEQEDNIKNINTENNNCNSDSNGYIEKQIKHHQEQYEMQKKTDNLVDNTLSKMLPLFLLCMMMLDNKTTNISNKNDKDKLDDKLIFNKLSMIDIELD